MEQPTTPPIRVASSVSPNQRRASVRSAGRARRVHLERHLLVLSARQTPLARPRAAASSVRRRSHQRARTPLEGVAFLERSRPRVLVRLLHQVSVQHRECYPSLLTLHLSAIGAPAPVTTGTINPPYAPYAEKDANSGSVTLHYQSISCMPQYRGSSFEVSACTRTVVTDSHRLCDV